MLLLETILIVLSNILVLKDLKKKNELSCYNNCMLIPFLTKKVPMIENSMKVDILSPFLKTQHEMLQNLNLY